MITSSAIPAYSKEMFVGLERGIRAIIRISAAVTDNNQLHCEVQNNVLDAKKHFDQTANVVNSALRAVDGDYENLIRTKGALERQQKKEKADLENLEIVLKSNESVLQRNMELLPDYQRRVGVAEEQVQNQKAKMDQAEVIAGVGAGLMVIPIIGWIVGGTMLAVGQIDYNEAVDTRSRAKTMLRNLEEDVKNLKEKIQANERSVDTQQRAIGSTNAKMEEVKRSIGCLQEQCETMSSFQHKLREAVHFVDTLAGQAKVAEVHVRRFIQMKALMDILGSMIDLIEEIPGIELMQNVQMNRLVDEMSANFTNLKALTDRSHRDQSSSSELESWY